RSEISKRKRNALIGFVIFMLLFHASQVFAPPMPAFLDPTVLSISAIISYFVFAALAFWIDGMDSGARSLS
ncbi:MAG: hypothetical protein AAFP02_09015, partial [Bacteroidota bacterium]